jgi:uncharacterized protein (TIRG00374 family)
VSHVTGTTTRRLLLVLALVGTIAFGYLSIRHVHLRQIWDALRRSNYWWMAPSVALTALAVVVRVQRWRLLFRPERRPPFAVTAHALMISYFFNNILPARMGELARILQLKRRAGVSRAEGSATVVLERLYDVGSLALLLFLVVPWLPRITWLRSVGLLAAILAFGIALGAIMLAVYGERPVRLALRPFARFGLSSSRADAVASSAGHGLAALRDRKIALNALAWTTVSWLVVAASAWVLMIGFRLHLPYTAAIVVVVAVNLAQVLPSLPSGLGVVEAATVLALQAYGIGGSRALAYALVYHVLNLLPFVAAGPLLLSGGGWRPRELAQLEGA